MRTKLIAAAAFLAAGLASSMAQSNVYSLNVVGYVNRTFTGGGLFTLTANPLNTTNNTLGGVFGGAGVGLPTGSQVQVWNPATQDFSIFGKIPVGTGWGNGGSPPVNGSTVPFAPGQGVFVKISGANFTNTYVGEVMQGSLTNSTGANFNLVGSMTPQAGLASALSLAPAAGAQVQQWDVVNQGLVVHGKTPIGWSGGEPNIEVGEGFFLKNNAPYSWVQNFTVQ
jgi:hypothetical protein